MTTAGLLQLHQGEVRAPDPAASPLPGGAAAVVRFFMDVPQVIQIGGGILAGIAAVVLAVVAWKRRATIVGWIRALPLAVQATAAAVLLAAGSVASVGTYRVYDFVEHDNRFCTGCHVMEDAFVRFQESAHNELGCKDCHAQPKTESARQLFLWVTERPMEVGGDHSPVPDARCTSCHVNQDAERWPQIAASLGHQVHFDSDHPELGGLMCVGCHGVTVHEFTPVDATCGECHADQSHIRLGIMGAQTELHCVVCHDFMGQETSSLPGVEPSMAMLPAGDRCLACHQMAAVFDRLELASDPHGLVCGACHDPHQQDQAVEAVETCQGCHQGVDTLTVFHTGTHAPVLPNCIACHTAHSWRVDGNDCIACHGPTPDAPRRPGGSASLPATPAALTPALPVFPLPWASLAMHGAGWMGPEPPPDAVTDSAPGAAVQQARRPFLHTRHEAIGCVQCHGRAGEHGVLTVRTERDCAACHHDPARAYECRSCHDETSIPAHRDVDVPLHLSVWEGVRSRVLPFDHGNHEGLSCQQCHTGPVLLAPEVGCAGCHADHHRPEAECSSCHVPSPMELHGLESHLTCSNSGCHAGTAGERPALSRTLCLMCHADQRDHEPGLSCHDCHMVPQQPPLRPGTGSRPGSGMGGRT